MTDAAPAPTQPVAQSIGGHTANTTLLLDGLTAIDVVTKTDGLYENTAVA